MTRSSVEASGGVWWSERRVCTRHLAHRIKAQFTHSYSAIHSTNYCDTHAPPPSPLPPPPPPPSLPVPLFGQTGQAARLKLSTRSDIVPRGRAPRTLVVDYSETWRVKKLDIHTGLLVFFLLSFTLRSFPFLSLFFPHHHGKK